MAESSGFEGYGVVLLCFSLGFTGLEKRKGEALRREQWLMERVRREIFYFLFLNKQICRLKEVGKALKQSLWPSAVLCSRK